jgi:predicted nucleic acid-binding protein
VPLTVEIHERAVHIAGRYGYSIFDSLTIAAALHIGAGTLYSEDMRDGQAIDGLTIRNPFARQVNGSSTPVRETLRLPAVRALAWARH